jgi:hypothetical protein
MTDLIDYRGNQISIRRDGDAFQAVAACDIVPNGNVPGKPYLFSTRELALAAAMAYIDHILAHRNDKKFRGCNNVHEYFVKRLGLAPDEASLKDLPCDSNCGKDCVAAIDAACKFLKHAEAATGKDGEAYTQTLEALNDILETYWCG